MSATDSPPPFDRLLRIAEQADVLDDPDSIRLLAAAVATSNDRVTNRVATALKLYAAHRLQYPFSPPEDYVATPDQSESTIRVGQIIGSSSSFSVSETALSKHVLAAGQSGAGKTTLFYTLMHRLPVPWWTFDLKRDYRHLAADPRQDVVVVPWQTLRLNPLRPPPGVEPRRWAQVVAEVFGHANALLSASKNYVMAAVMELYEAYDIETGTPHSEPADAGDVYVYPTLHDLYDGIDDKSVQPYSKESQYRGTVLNRLDGLLRVAGDIFAAKQGLDLQTALTQNIVFEFDGLRTDLQDFLMELLFAAVYEYRLAHSHRDQSLQHAFFLDEGKRVFSVYKERSDAAGIPHIADVTAKMREFGEALIVADQEPTKLTESIKANTFTKILLPTGSASQFRSMAGSMQLSDRQRAFAHQLGVGQALIQSGNQSARPVQFPQYHLDKHVTDADLRQQHHTAWSRLFPAPGASPAASETTTNELAESVEADTAPRPGQNSRPEPAELELPEHAAWLLKDIARHPFRPVTERYNEGMPSRYKGNQAKTVLEDHGLVDSAYVHLGRGRMKLFEVTPDGRAYLAAQEVVVDRTGRGGIVHQFWQQTIAELVETRGGTARLESEDADVYAELDGRTVAFEVAMGNNQREIDHIEKHLAGVFDAVVVACRNRAVRDGLRERAADHDVLSDAVSLRLVREFLDTDSVAL